MRKYVRLIPFILGLVLFGSPADATTCPAPPTLANGQTANANDILGVLSCINGNFAPTAGPSFTGNVGIGTASPAQELDIANAGVGSSNMQFTYTGAPTLYHNNINNLFSNTASLQLMQFSLDSNGTTVTPLILLGNGNVGIGVSTPSATLSIQGSGTGSGVNFRTTNASQTPLISAFDNGNVAMGASNSGARLNLGVSTDNTGILSLEERSANSVVFGVTLNNTSIAGIATKNIVWSSTSAGSDIVFGPSTVATTALVLKANGNIGVGTISPATSLDVAGTIRQSGCTTAGTLAVDGSGDIICSSDARLKNVLGDYAGGLAVVVHLSPKLFMYKSSRGDPNETFVHAGFLAQNVMSVIPQASALQRDGYYSLDTTAILAAAVNAVKELKAVADKQDVEIAVLKTKLVDSDRRLVDARLRQASAIEELRVEIAEIRQTSRLKTASR
ncbi:MAG: tail fiber domain-containing protein [Rhizomicrobium sp.]